MIDFIGSGGPFWSFPLCSYFICRLLLPCAHLRFDPEAGIPVVPIVISGTRSALRGGQWFPRPSNLNVHIAKAMRAGGSDFSAAVRLRDTVRARMLALCGEPDLALEKALL